VACLATPLSTGLLRLPAWDAATAITLMG